MGWLSRTKKVLTKFEEDKSFIENGSRLLEATIKSYDGTQNPIRFFSRSELEKATNNYTHPRFGSFCFFYMGRYQDENILVKRFPETWKNDNIIHEIVIVSQMNNHKNIIKLLGCCLETKFPLLVFDFACNGNLSDYIIKNPGEENEALSWESKLRIATEIAYAVAYLHMSKSNPVIHRNIKLSNILLDQNFVAKLTDFHLSVPIPQGKTHVEDDIVGTGGYVDPESVISGRFTVKSDVYGFGIVLLEMITGIYVRDINYQIENTASSHGEEKIDPTISDGDGEIDNVLISGRDEVIDFLIKYQEVREEWFKAKNLTQGNAEHLMACAELSLRCIKVNSAERPTMKEVVKELRRIGKTQSSISKTGTSQLQSEKDTA